MFKKISLLAISLLILASILSCAGPEAPSVPAGTAIEYSGTGGTIAIGPDTGTDTNFTIIVPDSGTISTFTSVTLTTFYSFRAYWIKISLIAPDGTTVILDEKDSPAALFNGDYSFSTESGAKDQYSYNYVTGAIISDIYKAAGDLSSFNGKSMNGTWTLRFTNYGANYSSLGSLKVKFNFY